MEKIKVTVYCGQELMKHGCEWLMKLQHVHKCRIRLDFAALSKTSREQRIKVWHDAKGVERLKLAERLSYLQVG